MPCASKEQSEGRRAGMACSGYCFWYYRGYCHLKDDHLPGHRIYYVPPRMVGAIQDWSGKDAASGASWLLDHVADQKFNAIWFSPMGQPTAVEKISHGQMRGGSYYAQRDHFRLGDEFSAGKSDDEDLKHLQHFAAKAK